MLCQHLFLASCICILRYPLIWLAPSPTCRLSLPIPAALRYPEPSAGRAEQLWPSSYSAEEDNTTRVLLTSKCIFTGFPLESLAAPTWTPKTRLMKHNGIRRERGTEKSTAKGNESRRAEAVCCEELAMLLPWGIRWFWIIIIKPRCSLWESFFLGSVSPFSSRSHEDSRPVRIPDMSITT